MWGKPQRTGYPKDSPPHWSKFQDSVESARSPRSACGRRVCEIVVIVRPKMPGTVLSARTPSAYQLTPPGLPILTSSCLQHPPSPTCRPCLLLVLSSNAPEGSTVSNTQYRHGSHGDRVREIILSSSSSSSCTLLLPLSLSLHHPCPQLLCSHTIGIIY